MLSLYGQQPCPKDPSTQTFSTIIKSEGTQQFQFDLGYSGIQDSDSGQYLICGESKAYFNQDIFVNRLDDCGDVIQSMVCDRDFTLEGARWMNESINNQNLSAGGYVYTGSYGSGNTQDLLFKATDKSGSIVSATIYDPNQAGKEIGYEVIEDSNGEYVAVGQRIGANNQLSAYAVGLDQNFNTKWVMNYDVEGFAWSVTEIETPISPNLPTTYAITGVSRTSVLLFIINATNGANIYGNQFFTYDLDNDPSTREVGHSINTDQNGDVIITGSANRASVSTGIEQNVLFVMRVPINNLVPGGGGIFGAFDFVYLHDIQNSENEIARHIIANEKNEYIITGRHSAKNDNNNIIDGRAFIMSLRDNGFTNMWINEYTDPEYYGTNGERVEQTKDGGYYMTGSIWNHEIAPSGIDITDYNQFAVKTDELGRLYECDCCRPIEAEPLAPDAQLKIYQYGYNQEEIPPIVQYRVEEVPIREDHCDQYCPSIPCDINTTLSFVNQTDSCCIVSLDLTNGMIDVYSIQIDIIAGGVFFDLVTVNAAAPLLASSTPFNITLQNSTPATPIPPGFIIDYLTFCYGINAGISTSQTLQITYYDQFGNPFTQCTDILITECEVTPPPDDCYDVNFKKIECVPGQPNVFKMTFTVTNNTLSDTLGDITFFPVGGGIFVLPAPLTITPSVLPGFTSADQCLTITTSGPFPKLIQLTHSMVDTSGLFCCTDLDPMNVMLPNCCSPCDDPNEQFVQVSSTSTQLDSCCHSLDIITECDNLMRIEAEILSPGVSYSSINVGGGYASSWTANNLAPNLAEWVPNSAPATNGSYNDLVQFCLFDPTGTPPQDVAIHYYIPDGLGGDEILCSDTLRFQCELEEKCLEVEEYDVYCDPTTGKFYLNFCIKNVSMPPFTASEIALYVPAPYNTNFAVSPNVFNGLTFMPNDIFCGTTEINGIPAPATGDMLKIQFEMHRNLPGVPYECCEIREEICITLPPCGCFDPNDPYCCDELDVTSRRIPGNWCFNTEFTNNASNDFVQVNACILTSNRAFSSYSANGSYTVVNPNSTTLIATHGSGNIPLGTTDVMDFCLIKTGGLCPFWGCTTVIEYKWIQHINNTSVIACRDTVRYRCNLIFDQVPLDLSKCVGDVITRTRVDDNCIDYTVEQSDLLSNKIGLMFEIMTPDISITDLNLNPGINPNAVQVDDGTLVYFDLTMIDLNTIQGPITEMCYSDIPVDGVEIMIHWVDESSSGDITRCTRTVRLKQCPNGTLSMDPIPSGIYQHDLEMDLDGKILSGSGVVLEAGSQIVFDPGFEIQLQGTLTANIKACIIVEED